MADPLYTAPEFGWTEGTSPTALPVEIQQHPQQLPRIAGTNNCRGVSPDVDPPLDAPRPVPVFLRTAGVDAVTGWHSQNLLRQKEKTMSVTVILELRFKPESVADGREVMGRALQDTRAFDGNLRTDVLVDEDDEAHWLIYELWDTVDHDEAYRRFRAGEGKLTQLPPLLASAPVKTRYSTTDV
jgi:quinol monooxygenase YgiN